MTSRRLLVYLCVTVGAMTCSLGAFPALLPEIGASARLSDLELGMVAGTFGLSRMVVDVPAGLLVTHHVRRAMLAAPVFMLAGVASVASAAGLPWLLLGRVLMGVGHTLGMLAGLTTILRAREARGLASALNAFEFSAMTGILVGVGLVGSLPGTLPWNVAFALAAVPVAGAIVAIRRTLPALPPPDATRPWFARSEGAARSEPPGDRALVLVAFAAGTIVALTYGTVESFLIPLRGSREFGLDRAGVARLLMLAQACDIAALLPLGAIADRRGTARVLGIVLMVYAAALALVAFATMPGVVGGCVLFGLAMAGWMLPLGLLRAGTPAAHVAWRTAMYRVFVDGGLFLGPFLSGVLAARAPSLLPAALLAALLALGLVVSRLAREPRAEASSARAAP
jgi:DHA1 family L-arabinose/isopropyl-beta-D-thiogalactopyranoside export protein-like MFS transporter